MKEWEKRQAKKGYLTWQEYMEAVEEDKAETPVKLGSLGKTSLMRREDENNRHDRNNKGKVI